MKQFRGDLNWIHEREGHAGKPYWPGGQSGVTLDPGVDLGYADDELVNRYQPLVTPKQFTALKQVRGVRGDAAVRCLEDPIIIGIRVEMDTARRLFPLLAEPYWVAIVARFPVLLDPACPDAVHTVLLSLAYNRGPKNPDLSVLTLPLNSHNWHWAAFAIGNMQQTHTVRGVRRRRQLEALYLLKALES